MRKFFFFFAVFILGSVWGVTSLFLVMVVSLAAGDSGKPVPLNPLHYLLGAPFFLSAALFQGVLRDTNTIFSDTAFVIMGLFTISYILIGLVLKGVIWLFYKIKK